MRAAELHGTYFASRTANPGQHQPKAGSDQNGISERSTSPLPAAEVLAPPQLQTRGYGVTTDYCEDWGVAWAAAPASTPASSAR